MKQFAFRSVFVALLSSSSLIFIAPQAIAHVRGHTIDLKAQPLNRALVAISSKTGVKIRCDPSQIAGLRSNPLHATGAKDAIAQAIHGTSLSASGSDELGYVVSASDLTVTKDGEITVIAQRDEAEQRYLVSTTASSTRDGRTLREQPQSATVISSKLMADQQIQTVTQALQDAAGATVNLGNVQGAPSYTIRGFYAQPLTGGLNDPSGLSQPVVDVERVEVLKGPAALLAGANNLGGSVNIVTKKPIAQPLLDVTAEYGSYGDWRAAVDGSTALDPDGHFSARLVAQYARADHNAGHYDGRFENLVAPSLRYKDSKFDLTGGIEYSDVRSPAAPYGAFNYAGQLIDLSAKPVGPTDSGFRLETRRIYYDAKWSPTDWLSFVSRSQISYVDTHLKIYALAANLSPSLALLLKTDELQKTRTAATDDYARLNFHTGSIKQTISAGFSFSDYRLNDYYPLSTSGSVLVTQLFGASPNFTPFAADVAFNYMTRSLQYGYYGQDLIEWGPIHLLGAVRDNQYTSISFISAKRTQQTKYSVTPQAGAVIDITHRLSIYGNYIQGFLPSFYLDRDGALLPPEKTRNIEVGAKWDVIPDRLAFTTSVFRIRETNVPVAISGLTNRYDVIAGQQSRGVEADLTGEILPGWDVAMNYSYGTNTLLKRTATKIVVPGQPDNRYSIFTKYTLLRGPLKSLGGSIGLYGFSKSYVNALGTLSLPAQTKVDANIYYKLKKLSINFGIDNLLGDKVYGLTQTSTYVPINPGRTFRLTLVYSVF